MNKVVKKILSVFSAIIIVAVAIPIILGILLQIGFIQNFAVDRLSEYLSRKAGTVISVGRVDIGFFNKAIFEEVYVGDMAGDTMIYAGQLRAGINNINFLTGQVSIGNLTLSDGKLYLEKDSSGVMNIKYILDNFAPEEPQTKKRDFRINANELNLVNVHFKLRDVLGEKRPYGVDFKDLDIDKIYMQARRVKIAGDNVDLSLQHLSFKDKSGLYLQHLYSSYIQAGPKGFRLNNILLETPLSTLDLAHLHMLFDDWNALGDTAHAIAIDAEIKPSKLSFATLAYFGRKPTTIPTALEFEGSVSGTIDDITGQLRNVHSRNTYFDLDFRAWNLPDTERAIFDVSLGKLITDGPDITALYADITGKTIEDLSPVLARAGTISFDGSFNGRLDNFAAEGHLTTYQGGVDADLIFTPAPGGRGMRFVGNMSTEGFMLGNLLGVQSLGGVAMDAHVDAAIVKDSVVLATSADIKELVYADYPYGGIKMNGSFHGNTFDGTITVDDPNLELATTGRFNIIETIPAYNFDMTLKHADLVALGINKRDSVSTLAGRFSAYATGNNIDNINGSAEIDSLTYINHRDTVHAGIIRLEAQNNDQLKKISMTSHFADIELRGRNSYRNIFPYMEQSLGKYVPSAPVPYQLRELIPAKDGKKADKEPLADETVAIKAGVPFDDGYYMLTANVKEANNVAAIFMPGLEVAEGTSMAFFFNPYLDQFNFNFKSDYIEKGALYFENLNVDSRNHADSLSFYLSSDLLGIGNNDLRNFSIIGGMRNNQINIGSRFSNPDEGTQGLVNTTASIVRTPEGQTRLDVLLHPASFSFKRKPWVMNQNHILIDSTGIEVKGLRVAGSEQELTMSGKAGKTTLDTLTVKLNNFDISPASSLLASMGYGIDGRATGSVQVASLMNEMQFFASINLNDLKLNDYPLGNPVLSSNWDRNSRGIIRMEVTNGKGEKPVTGFYNVNRKRYRANFKFPNFDLYLLEPLYGGILTNTGGKADVDLTLTGGAGTPTLNGTIDIGNYDMTVDFTKARYSTKGVVNVMDNRFTIENAPLTDFNGGNGTLNGYFDSKHFKHIVFGVFVRFQDLLCLNTTAADNSDFYGKAWGKGNFAVEGSWTNTNMTIVAETARNSEFVLPLSDVETISEADFIRFVDPNARPEEKKQSTRRLRQQQQARRRARMQREGSILGVDIDLRVLPNTHAQIILDQATGNMLTGNGDGHFNMRIVPSQDIFTMSGPFTIQQGRYHFVQAIIDKWFTIQPNGILRWTGDPTNPDVNIDVSYRVKTSLAPLTGGIGGQSNTATIECGINLTEKLRHPAIRLSVKAPTADPETQNVVRNLLNTEEAVSMQFIALLSAGVFIPDMGAAAIGTMSGTLASATGFEFLSNQISNMISSDKYNLRFGYRPGDNQTTPEEFNFDFSTDIIENKLSVELGGNYNLGNVGVYNQRTPFTGDAYLTWVLNRSGNLRLKGFTRVIDRFDETQGLQESGVGVYFRQDFKTLRDLVDRYHQTLARTRQNKADRKAARQARKKDQAHP